MRVAAVANVSAPRLMDLKKITTPILLHELHGRIRFPALFMIRCKLTVGRFKKTVDPRFPKELVDLVALPAWVYINLKKKLGQRQAYEIMRVALLVSGTALQNLQYQTIDKERNFNNFCDLELENNRVGIIRWNTLQIVERTDRRFEMKITRCMFHEFAKSVGVPELTPVVCQVDNAFFNSYLPDKMMFDRGGSGHRIADGAKECNFIWNSTDTDAVAPGDKAGRTVEAA